MPLLLNPLSANPTKWPNTLKQFVDKFPTNCLSVFDHFMNLALKGLKWRRLVTFRLILILNPVSTKFIKWSNTLKQFVAKLSTNCLSVFDHFVGLAHKGLRCGYLIHSRKLSRNVKGYLIS